MSSQEATTTGFRARVLSRARDWQRRFSPLHAFGGRPLSDASLPVSRISDRPLHLTFDLDLSDEDLGGLGITGLRRLALLANLHVDPEARPLLIRHLDEGRRLELVDEPDGEPHAGMPDELPQLPVELRPLTAAESAVETVDEHPEPHEPLHQVGGAAICVHVPRPAPVSPESGRPMHYVATVDSVARFPIGDRDVRLSFGDEGLLHVYWCDAGKLTASIVAT